MDKKQFKKIVKKRRVYLFILGVLIIGIAPILLKGVQFGMDFEGGTMIDLKLDEEIDPSKMATIVGVLDERVNSYGLKDVSITPQEGRFIRIEVAETDPDTVNEIESIIGQQGQFETLYNGEIVLEGSGITEVITNPQEGYGATESTGGYRWSVPFQLTSEASQYFASSVEGECTPQPGTSSCKELLYMFIDRPSNAVLLINESMYQDEGSIPLSLKEPEEGATGNTITIEEAAENSGADLVVSNEVDSSVLNKTQNKTVLIPQGAFDASEISNAATVEEVPKTSDYWVVDALNIENIVHLTPDVTSGDPVSKPSITGHSETEEAAFQEINRIQILLKSGKLPVGVQIEKVNRISPILGTRFLGYSLLAGLVALLAVGAVISIRYKKKKIIIPLLMTSFSEVLMTVGAAAWIGWQIDLPAIAGIIAVVGTGVDHQVIMTDEAIRKTTDRVRSLSRRIKRAFSVILRSSVTTIFAMFPLLFMSLGALQGFAIVTILGSLIGVSISRPAYGAIINEVL